ncbi:MAG: class IV adenylate cyclase [Candidatus Heimdallarchaeota archaeon]|nr:class IV adenylate cyclase [Candidatus Heimdallarchaeota archaeon]MDH5646238.1 class IV adenylate cyclase [Candidatus Heimdallarchaeota archaeon]
MIEYEMKFQANHDLIRQLLQNEGGKFIEIEENIDIYYRHPSRDFGQTDEALRIRQIQDKFELTYKGPKLMKSTKTRFEANVKLFDSSMDTILIHLGFSVTGKVIKTREKWLLNNVTISLDSVKGFGEYVELEIIADEFNEREVVIQRLHQIAKKINLDISKEITTSYLEMVLNQ